MCRKQARLPQQRTADAIVSAWRQLQSRNAATCRHAPFCRAVGLAARGGGAVRPVRPRAVGICGQRRQGRSPVNAKLDLARRDSRLAESADRPLRILHVLDHSLPLHSGYTFRTLAILTQQRALGWETFQLTSPKQDSGDQREETIGDWMFSPHPARVGPDSEAAADPVSRLDEHLEHSACGSRRQRAPGHHPRAFAGAERVACAGGRADCGHPGGVRGPCILGRRRRRSWHGARVGAALSVDARAGNPRVATCRCRDHDLRGLRRDMLERGIPANKITVIPNAVDVSGVSIQDPDRCRVGAAIRTHARQDPGIRRFVLRLRGTGCVAAGDAAGAACRAAGTTDAGGRRAAGRQFEKAERPSLAWKAPCISPGACRMPMSAATTVSWMSWSTRASRDGSPTW